MVSGTAALDAASIHDTKSAEPTADGWLIVADDLTGACDSAVPFAMAGQQVRVDLNGAATGRATVRALSTETRDVPPEQARARLQQIASSLEPGVTIFKKVDSVFRGNTSCEIVAAANYFPADLVVIAPAYPALGRWLRSGVLIVEEGSRSRTIRVKEQLEGLGLQLAMVGVEELRSGMRGAIPAGAGAAPVLLCDAWLQSDLERLVRWAQTAASRILWIGSGGLAHALAGEGSDHRPDLKAPSRPGMIVCFVGTNHPATMEQVSHFCRAASIYPIRCGDVLSVGEQAAMITVSPNTCPDQIRRSVELLEPGGISAIFLTGGETAMKVSRALGFEGLRLATEVAPGVPFGYAEGGAFDGVPVILKSGGFGEPTLLCDIFRGVQGKESVSHE